MFYWFVKKYICFVRASFVFMFSRLIDLFSTYVSINSWNQELNFFYKILNSDLFLFLNFNFFLSIGFLYIFFLIYKKYESQKEISSFILWVLYFLSAMFFYLAFHNLTIS